MQKKFLSTYLFIFFALIFLMSLSPSGTERLRGAVVALFSPVWERVSSIKIFIQNPFKATSSESLSIELGKQKLEAEHQMLIDDHLFLSKYVQEQLTLAREINKIAAYFPLEATSLSNLQRQTAEQLLQKMSFEVQATPAKVIFRSMDTWNQCFWINVGEVFNEVELSPRIALNSPVVVGRSLIGVIDYVGKHQSRVRLMSDSRLCPSVQAVRGGETENLLNNRINYFLGELNEKKDLLPSGDRQELFRLLNSIKESLSPFNSSSQVAKGQLEGAVLPLKFGQRLCLKGVGFSRDALDTKASNQSSRSEKKIDFNVEDAEKSLLQIGDVLVTTGLDGVFPPGFQVAVVSYVDPLKEGDYYYNLKAEPIIDNLEETLFVFVLPPYCSERIIESGK